MTITENKNYIDIDINIKYTNKEYLTVDDIVNALKSAESLILRTKPIIAKASGAYELLDMQVYIGSIQSGSLKETFTTRLFYETIEKQDKAHEAFVTFIENTNMTSVAIAAVGAVIGVGALLSVQSLMRKKSAETEAHNSIITNINFGDNTSIGADDLQKILDNLPDKKGLAKDVVQFAAPAKKDKSATIEIGNDTVDTDTPDQKITITAEQIAEIPDKYEPPQPEEKSEKYSNITIDIVALDVDNPKKWSGTIEGIVSTRVKLEFADNVDIGSLSRDKIKADVEVISKFNKNTKKYKPTEIYISKIINN